MTFQNLLNNDLPPLVLVAGGKSERMKTLKGLLPFQGKFWLEHLLQSYQNIQGQSVCIVLGYRYKEYLEKLPFLKINQTVLHNNLHITTLINPEPEFGPFSTIQTGLSFYLKNNPSCDYFCFQAVDTPPTSKTVWNDLFLKIQEKQADMIYPKHENKDGHPVIVSKDFAKQIVSYPCNKGRMNILRQTLADDKCQTLECLDKNVGLNLNTPEDWQNFLSQNRTKI